MICSLSFESKPDHRFFEATMALASKIEYDATALLDTMCPNVEVKLLGDPTKMVRHIIKDDGNETVSKIHTLPEYASITDLMEAPRIPMLRTTKVAMIDAFDQHVRAGEPLPSWYATAMIYDGYEVKK